ncbi:murein transglycosylase [Gluconobacter morbifer G707]|uniref:Murein transglycosylase n=1 Tax=Gluconobacter morbifer G707 TaxID=1088869 RepID=G6XHV2_9PROT|nr:murein transglycosylase [Gluconobacter morbifer G707]
MAGGLLLGAASPSTPTVRERLSEWLVLTAPGATDLPPARYAAFLQQTPQWPKRARILWRYQSALARTSDPATLDQLCPALPLTLPTAFLNCADHLPDAPAKARTLWLAGAGTAQDEQAFLVRFGADLTPDDHWQRYEHLEATGQIAAAKRQIDRLSPDRQPLATARIAERSSSPDAESLFQSLPGTEQSDPVLIRFRLRALRRADRLDDALALWRLTGYSLQAGNPGHEWSAERISLARAFLLAGRAQDAAELANDTTLSPDSTDRLEAQLLSGLVALRLLQKPDAAEAFFQPLTKATSLQMQARGYYWVGRARDARGNHDGAQQAFRSAARYPTTFAGQLAIAALNNERDLLVGNSSSPAFDQALQAALQVIPAISSGALQRQDLVEAATDLVQAGDPEHAQDFLMMLDITNPSVEGQKAVADLGRRLGIAAPEVFASYALARKGVALYPEGFPDPYPDVSTGPPGLLTAIIRQESGFDPNAVSSAHAIGLLQLLPGAARDVARRGHLQGLNVSASGLLDPQTNLTVGNAYVSQLLTRFGQVIPYALAAYNAGPHKVDLWLRADPPPVPLTEDSMLDWIERLPYRETRLYIENIEANMMIYRVSHSHAG